MPRRATKLTPRTPAELARSAGSDVAVVSHRLKGGAHGKQGAARNRHERRTWRQDRPRGPVDD